MFGKIITFFTKPAAKLGLGVLVTIGFIFGAISWHQFNQVMDYTSEEEFCVSCHSMQKPLEELKQTAHWSNNSGVTATCSDCHLPHNYTDKFARKVQAIREVWAEFSGKYKDEGAFEKHRLEMAEREWARFEANGSKECKACHSYERMNFDKMTEAARKAMIPAAEKDQSCMDCHKGIAHHLPKVDEAAAKAKLDELAKKSLKPGNQYYTKTSISLFGDENLSQNIGELETAVPLTLVKAGDNADLVEFVLWRKAKGLGRTLYHDFGKNITNAVLTKEFMSGEPKKYEVLETKEDPVTALGWQKIKFQGWVAKAQLLEDIAPIWANAESQYKTQCSTCHKQPDVAHFDSNSWIGLFNGMVGFTNMNKATAKEVLRYLQMHASDSEGATH